MKVDFHCHTTASDGTLSPAQLIARAGECGVDLLSITDHDTLAAYRQLPTLPNGLTLITGVEFSCQWQKRGIHLVGLNVDPASAAMVEAVTAQTRARRLRAEMIAEKLEKFGAEAPLAGALAEAGHSAPGRPHFARHLANSGFVAHQEEAFKKYLGTGKPCDIKACWPEPGVIIDWIRSAGGVAVLAHPGKYNFTRSRLVAFLQDFKTLGGQAMEVVSGRQLPAQTRDFAALCQQFGLLASLGSDFHSPDQHWLDLGTYSTPPLDISPVWALWQ